jgi:hypothetical protein
MVPQLLIWTSISIIWVQRHKREQQQFLLFYLIGMSEFYNINFRLSWRHKKQNNNKKKNIKLSIKQQRKPAK